MLLNALIAANAASAAGFYTTPSGTRAIGRGGAFIASVDDLSAQFHNPAGLVRLDGAQLMLNATSVQTFSTFTRIDPDGRAFEPSPNQGPPFVIPAFGFATRFGLDNTVFALGLYPPHAPDLQYDEKGAQRYSLVDSIELQAYAGPTVAHRFNDWLSVGLGLQWTFLRATRDFFITTCNPETFAGDCRDDASRDIRAYMEAFDPAQFSANAGVLLQPGEDWSIGLFVQPPITYRADASITTTIPEDHSDLGSFVEGTEFSDEDATLSVNFPLILRAGLAYQVSDNLDVEVATAYQGWSVNQEIIITDVDIAIPLTESAQQLAGTDEAVLTDDIALETNNVDSFSVRLGGGYSASDTLDLRAGTFYETTSIPKKYLNVSALDANKVGIGLGGSWTASKRLTLDIGLSANIFLIQEITDSESYQILLDLDLLDPSNSEMVDGLPVGNGELNAVTTMGSLGATYHFGR